MSTNYNKSNIYFFIISYALLIIFIFLTSYKFFISDFMLLEKNQNERNLKTLLNNMNNDIENLKNITNDYSKGDDTYDFAKDENKKYIYENFREGTQTLQNLKIDAIIYLKIDNNILFSNYSNKDLESNKNDFENYLINKFKDNKIVNSVINFNSNFLYLSKNEILKSDDSGSVQGYIITIKSVTNDFFNRSNTIFKDIKISSEKVLTANLKLDFSTLKNIRVDTSTDSECILNNIDFFDYNNEYIISIKTSNIRNIVNNGKETVYIFNLIVSIILFLIFFFIYKNQYLIQTLNETLNKKVAKRTRQLDKAYKKLENTNKELYELANIDSLTKIRNRRSYFIKSEEVLEEAIKENYNLCILMIDIDHFKSINDKYGHAVGDKVLIDFCFIVNSIIDDETIFGRIGGEEFCITFYNKSTDKVNEISEKIRNKCANTLVHINNHKIKFTVSMGLSSRNKLTNIDKILQKSDELLYQAKNSGRDRLVRTNR